MPNLLKIHLFILALCVVSLSNCAKSKPTRPVYELREEVILRCVGDFKNGLVELSKEHSELANTSSFDHSHLGFTYVNPHVDPNVRISLSIEDSLISEMGSVPVGAEEHTQSRFTCALQLHCGDRPELKSKIRALYDQFKEKLIEELDQIEES